MRIIALEYHDIVSEGAWDQSGFPGTAAATYKLSVDAFRHHLDALQHSKVLIMNDARVLEETNAAPPRVILTFDDGGAGYLNYAVDELEARGWRGHMLMTTDYIGKPGFLTVTDLRELAERGHVIGSHSRTHPMPMSGLSSERIAEEWSSSVGELQEILGKPVEVASVPGGFYSNLVAELAAASGIRVLFTSEPVMRVTTIADCVILGRYTLRRSDGAGAVAGLVGSRPFARASQWCTWNAKKVVKSVAGGFYGRVRERILGS